MTTTEAEPEIATKRIYVGMFRSYRIFINFAMFFDVFLVINFSYFGAHTILRSDLQLTHIFLVAWDRNIPSIYYA